METHDTIILSQLVKEWTTAMEEMNTIEDKNEKRKIWKKLWNRQQANWDRICAKYMRH